MKRMDRLMAIMIALQQKSETALSLAEKLEVSRRTILRDMQSLSEMGVPLYAVSGPQGGFQLMEGYKLPPLQLSSQEALTVLFALQGLTQYADTPFNSERWTVRDKIKSILPHDMMEQIQPSLLKLEMNVPTRNYSIPHLALILEMTTESKWISVLYSSLKHRRRLLIHPSKIYAAHGFWYCEAYSHTHGETRLFRVDRIDEIQEEIPPEDLSHTYLQEHVSMPEHNPAIPIRVKLTYRGMLQVERDEHIGECLTHMSEDQWIAAFDCPATEWEWAIQLFFSLGMDAEVLQPLSLRDAIHSKAKEVYKRYSPQ